MLILVLVVPSLQSMGSCVPTFSKCDLYLFGKSSFLLNTGTVANQLMSNIVKIYPLIDNTSLNPSVCQI